MIDLQFGVYQTLTSPYIAFHKGEASIANLRRKILRRLLVESFVAFHLALSVHFPFVNEITTRYLFPLQFRQNLLTLCSCRFKISNHVERSLGQIITLSTQDSLEATDSIL